MSFSKLWLPAPNYLRRKLAEPFAAWTVDQAALFRSLCLLGDDRQQARNLARIIPGAIDAIVAPGGHLVDEAERMQRRETCDSYSYSFDQNQRPAFRLPDVQTPSQ